MRRHISNIFFFAMLAACGTTGQISQQLENIVSGDPNFAQAWARAELQNEGEVAQRYIERYSPDAMWATNRPPRPSEWRWDAWPFNKAVAECVTAISPPVESASMVFKLDLNGVAVYSVTNRPGFIEDCVARKTEGLRAPSPPVSGFLLCHRYARVSDDTYKLEGCGPKRWQTLCTVKGTTTSCKSQFGS